MEYSQDIGPGLLGGGQPGERVREAIGNVGGEGGGAPDVGQAAPDLGQGGRLEGLDMPDNPGPAIAGRTPLVGTLRRAQGMPVIRDQLGGQLGS